MSGLDLRNAYSSMLKSLPSHATVRNKYISKILRLKLKLISARLTVDFSKVLKQHTANEVIRIEISLSRIYEFDQVIVQHLVLASRFYSGVKNVYS